MEFGNAYTADYLDYLSRNVYVGHTTIAIALFCGPHRHRSLRIMEFGNAYTAYYWDYLRRNAYVGHRKEPIVVHVPSLI